MTLYTPSCLPAAAANTVLFSHGGTYILKPPCDAERHELHADAERRHDNQVMSCTQSLSTKCFSTTMAQTTQSAT
ncbi:hypothetical protein F4W67_23145 [Pseudomonas caricapapayae]|nr:hypothetical protein F4W67_23145 [Pseudomonas caricapapayae]